MNAETITPPEQIEESKSMLIRIWDWLTAPSIHISDFSEQRLARLASSFLLVIAILDFIGGVARVPRMGLVSAFSGPLGYSFVGLALTYLISRTRWYSAAVFLFSLSSSCLMLLVFVELPESKHLS